jgi:tetratricopeptide (TPR) repeat protein
MALVAIFMFTGPKPEPPQVQQQSQPAKETPAPAQQYAQPVTIPEPPQPQSIQPVAGQNNSPQTQQIEPAAEQNEPDPFAPQATQKSHDPRIKQSHTATSAKKSGKPDKVCSAVQKENQPNDGATPLERLKKEYNSSDFLDIAQAAIAKNANDDALLALDNAPQNDKAFLLYIEALISADKLRAAKEKVQSAQINDAQYNLLAGELYQKMGRNKDALENFQTALTKPSRYRNIRDVRNDALYYTAVAYSEIYKDDPTPDNRGLALQSWRVVKNMYSNTPESNRYKKSVSELSSIN